MKVVLIVLAAAVLFAGCGSVETFEKVEDVFSEQKTVQAREIILQLPEEAAAAVMESDAGTLYLCSGYEITVQTMTSGDLNASVKQLTGFSADSLTIMETAVEFGSRYDMVWSAAGEAGDQVGRAALIDDGSHHYAVTVMASAADAGTLEESWNQLFGSFSLDSY